ncbi:exonuclease domain-containing protein [Acinetobacter sp.]|uniref:exonuclease domain-containing protein n=1 Tax=Acinetobacter sp. TaxID=472 RepID=UPI003890D718
MSAKLDVGFVIDCEATCWNTREEQGSKPNEIIEIGLAKLNYETGEVTKFPSYVVRPRFTQVSDFCTELTGWTQEAIMEQGKDIARVLRDIKAEHDIKPEHVWYSCGNYDKNMLSSRTPKGVGKLYGIKPENNPFDIMSTHVNVKTLFALKHKLKKEVGMDRMLQLMGETLEGRHHVGADDAYNIAKIAKHVIS